LRTGANVNNQNNLGNTPLHYANAFNYRKIVEVLVESGADETIRNFKKLMPWEGI
jgi:ankyrin repeat protein